MKRIGNSWILGVCALILMTGSTLAQENKAAFVSFSYAEASQKLNMVETIARIDGLDVEMIGFPWGQMVQNLILRYRSGLRTEAVQLQERWVPMLANLGALKDLNEVFGADVLAKTVDPGFLKMGEFNGKQYGIPMTGASIAMVANRKVLDAAGITELPKTMDEFYADLKAIKAAIPDSIPFGISTTNVNLIQVEAQIIFWQYGARFFEDGKVVVNSPEAREALKFIVKLINEGLIAKGNDRFGTRILFSQELVGFYLDNPSVRGRSRKDTGQGEAYDKNVLVLPTPSTGNGEPPRSVRWAHVLGIMTSGDVDVAAGKKIIEQFTMDADTQRNAWNKLGMFPTTQVVLAEIGKEDPFVSEWAKIASTALLDETAQFNNSAELSIIIGEEIEAAMLGAKSPDKAITDMAQRLSDAL